MSLKVKCAERKITGYFHNMLPRWINGRQTVFCIKKNVWDTMWPFFKAKETMFCVLILMKRVVLIQRAHKRRYMMNICG